MPAVIKSGQAARLALRLGTVDLADHARQAQGLLDEARAQATAIISGARAEAVRIAEQLTQEATQRGYREGLARGTEAGREEAMRQATIEFSARHEDAARMLAVALREINGRTEQVRCDGEQHLLEFAVQCATKLTFEVGRLHREAARENLKRALDLVLQQSRVHVRCNPKDAETIRTFSQSAYLPLQNLDHVSIIEDESIAPGGCIVDSGPHQVDASLETQVEQLVAILLGRTADA